MQTDSTFKIILEGGLGYGLSTDTLTKPGSRYGLSGIVRILFKTDHKLKFGLETGYLDINSYKHGRIENEFGVSVVNATLDAVPLMLVFSMDIRGFNINTGLGYYYVTAVIEAFDESVSDSRWNIGFYWSIGYKFSISEYFDLIPEIKWNSIGELGRTLLSAQLCLSYDLFRWQ